MSAKRGAGAGGRRETRPTGLPGRRGGARRTPQACLRSGARREGDGEGALRYEAPRAHPEEPVPFTPRRPCRRGR
ncbi:hypothetical protein GCM10017688_60650 [Streptomyces ramulosus]